MENPVYIYVYRQFHYSNNESTKVGVSKNPERRYRGFSVYQCGGFSFHKKWLMPDRKSALALETMVCNAFPREKRRELLAARYTKVCKFIEKNMPTHGAA